MTRLLPVLHALNMAVGSLCIAVLGLATHAIVVKDKVDPLLPSNMSSAGLGMLMWAGCGGIVDMLLFLCLIRAKPLHGKTVRNCASTYVHITLPILTKRPGNALQSAILAHDSLRRWLRRPPPSSRPQLYICYQQRHHTREVGM